LAVATAWTYVSNEFARGRDPWRLKDGEECLQTLDGWAVKVSAFESYRRVELSPKRGCLFPGFGMGYDLVIKGDKIIEAGLVE
jgi:hypothetical protein